MDLVAVSSIITRAQQAADQENSAFISPSEWLTYVNYGLRRMHDFLISASGDEYFLKSYTFALTNQTPNYTLPTDFLRERSFDLNVSPKPITMQRFQWRDRNKYQWAQFNWGAIGAAPMYCLVNNQVYFYPAPTVQSAGITMWYFPTLQSTTDGGTTWASGWISSPTSQVDGINGYEDLAVLYAALKAKTKEGTDTTSLEKQIVDAKEWIRDSVTRRNDGDPMFIGEVQSDGGGAIFFDR
jgi:hypothetical protein